jgi:hypothetical protein
MHTTIITLIYIYTYNELLRVSVNHVAIFEEVKPLCVLLLYVLEQCTDYGSCKIMVFRHMISYSLVNKKILRNTNFFRVPEGMNAIQHIALIMCVTPKHELLFYIETDGPISFI